ncbi:hypothetical protein Acsp03_70730 [Actinomadura sp. NBRC 104412]|nr:hypothetical protein Acsp03_70730 [Actinomadura sp. NBRC 104412]
MPEGAVYVGRPTRWGNPWRIVPVRDGFPWGDAADVIHETEGSCIGRFDLARAPYWACRAYRNGLSEELRAAARRELAGRNLVCWCPLVDEHGIPVPCHADILLEIANAGGDRDE